MTERITTRLIQKMAQLVDLGQWKLKETEDAVHWARGSLNGARRELEDDYYFTICYNNTLAYVTYAIDQSLEALEIVTEAKTIFRQIQFLNSSVSRTTPALRHLEKIMELAVLANNNAVEANKLSAEVFQLMTSWG